MSLDWPDPVVPPPPPAPIHVPVVDDREPAKRKKMILWDRVKFLILLVGLFWFWVWSEISDNPILPFGDAVRETAKHKWYLFVLFGLEVLRQVHYLISEHWAGYHRFWTEKVFGSLTRRTGRLKDYTRYRLARVFKAIAFLVILSLILGQFFDLPPAQALFELPSRFFDALPFILQMSFYLLFAVGQFAAIFWFLSRGGSRHLLPRRHQDAVLRRVGAGRRARARQGEHDVPRGAREDRGEGRLRPRRHPAVGPTGHRQDAHGRGRRRRDRQALRLRRPRRVHQHVHGCRHPQGEVALPEAPQARAALRRRDRLLRRGRLTRQPRCRSLPASAAR